jgi:hypothetical protein
MEGSKYITLLLPCYLEAMIPIFNIMGFAVVHSFDAQVLEWEVKEFDIDVALEWQHGANDHHIRDMLRKCEKEIPVFLSLNWNGRLPPDFPNLGYRDYLPVPWELDEMMGKFHEALPETKKPVLRGVWEKAKDG